MAISCSLEIRAPIHRVFALLTDPAQIGRWVDGIEEFVYTSPWEPEPTVGTTFRMRLREGGRIREYQGLVLAYDKPSHLADEIGNRRYAMRNEYRLTAIPEGTRLEMTTFVARGAWWVRLLGLCFGWLTRRIVARQMGKLKALAEAGA